MERHFPRQFVPVVGALLSLLLTPVGRAQDASAPATFSNYELAGNPFVNQFSVGTTCPNSSGTCVNTQGEPAIRADPAGNFYGSSENVFCVIGGLCGGTFAWKSTDAGAHFTTLPLPNSASSGRIGFSPAGGDTDIAVAPRKNANGFYNIYVASLQSKPPLAEIYVSTSRDGGATWSITGKGSSPTAPARSASRITRSRRLTISWSTAATTRA